MGRRIQAFDWSTTPLGPLEAWPQSLQSALSICLNSNFPIAIYWGGDLVLLYNDQWSPIPGEKHPRVLGRPAREAWPEIWHIIEPLFGRVMQSGEATRSRDQLLPMHRHGFTEECYFDYTFSPIRGEGGQVEGVFNAVLETTTRVIGERRLRTLRELGAWKTGEARTAEEACETATHILAENLHDLPFTLLYLLDGQRRATLAGLTGLERGSKASPAVVDLDAPDAPWPFRQVSETGKAAEVEALPLRFGPLPGGAWPESPQRAVVLPVAKSGQTELAGFVVAGISPRLALDDDYRGFLDLLAGHVAAAIASARAYEEERRRAEALAELDRAKTAFFSNVSHEFRTPLALLLGPAEDALADPQGALTATQRERVEVIHRNGRRLQRLVNTLLDFSRIEAGRVRATFEPTDLSAFTADLASNFRSACEKAGLTLTVDCPPLSERVFVDRQMWEKVILNLLSNAFKFTLDGEISVSLRQAGKSVELRVRDTGTGIPDDEMPRLFERFHRFENTRGRTHEGSGIGLALVQELVKLHGGSITAESQFGRGSTFTVSIPLGADHLPPEQVRRSPAPPAPTAAASSFVQEALHWLPQDDEGFQSSLIQDDRNEPLPSGERAGGERAGGERPRGVVADDNADMRRYIARLLSGQFTVEAVPDGAAALDAARRERPDLILSDVMMPRLDGFGLLRELRADPALATVPVILLSARAGEESRVEGVEAGADDYLVKPFSARELLARVTSQVQMARLRQEAEEAVRQSEERFRLFMNNSPTTAYIKDAEGRYVFVNRTVERQFARPLVEWVGKTDFDLFPPDEARLIRQNDQSVLAWGMSSAFEEVSTRPDGVRRYLSFKFPLFEQDGRRLLAGMSLDITEQKRAEELARESQIRERLRANELQTVLEAVPAVVWIAHDRECRRITGNRAASELLRLPHEANQSVTAPAGERPVHFKVMRDGVELRPDELPVQKAATGVEVRDFEEEVRFEDGKSVHLLGHAMPLRDEAGQVRGSVAAFVDITDRKRVEQMVRESESAFRGMADNAPAMLWVTNAAGQCTYLSKQWYGYTGRTPGAALSEDRLDVVHPDDAAQARRIFLDANKRMLPFTLDYRIRRHDGEYRWAVDAGLPRIEDGKFQGFVGSVFDVHERKLAEDANVHLVESLREADRRKDEFLATLAHELRNPLAPLRNGLQVLRLAGANEEMANQARTMMERQLGQMVHLIDDLLDLSRISRGKIELRKERIELAQAIQQAVETSRPAIEQAGHELTLELPPGPLYVDADVTRLAQVFSNLLNNAAKYTERGGRIRLTVQRQGPEAVVSVRDTGIGIPASMLARVFEMFTQVDRNLERAQGGLGIGLSIVKRLVEMHGGSVEATSGGHGLGSEFVVRLPAALSVVQPGSNEAQPPLAACRRRVLVVDDNRDAAVSLAMMLKLMGNETRTAHDGLEALDVAAAYRPDLILLDIGMPKMNGYDTARRLRQQAWAKEVVLVALTGWGQDEDRRKSQDAGFDLHMTKPIEPAALEKLLASLKTRTD